jgi:hypothetical protein
MAHGDIPVSPWFVEFSDYLQRKVTITVNYDNVTRAVINAWSTVTPAACSPRSCSTFPPTG